MQTNIEEMTNNYNLACAEAVRDIIHKLATKWGTEVVDRLNAENYRIYTGLYDDSLTIHAFIAKEAYQGKTYYSNPEMQKDVQETFDGASAQVVLGAMIHYGWGELDQAINWRIY